MTHPPVDTTSKAFAAAIEWVCLQIDDYSKEWTPNGVQKAVAAAIKDELRRRAARAIKGAP